MIIVINGTNRIGNKSQIITEFYHQELLRSANEPVELLSMEDVPMDMIHNEMFSDSGRSEALTQLQDDIIIPCTKMLFVLPEYNGGIPGMLKLFIDACSTYQRDASFKGKKVGMVGVAAGRAGNLRGMEHLTGVMNYLGAVVMPDKLPISSIHKLVDAHQLIDAETKTVLKEHAQSFLEF